jgi:hypothetical protein
MAGSSASRIVQYILHVHGRIVRTVVLHELGMEGEEHTNNELTASPHL